MEDITPDQRVILTRIGTLKDQIEFLRQFLPEDRKNHFWEVGSKDYEQAE